MGLPKPVPACLYPESLLLHLGVRKSPDNILIWDWAKGATLQLESQLNLFPRLYSQAGLHWENMFLASIKCSLAAADLACSTSHFPLPILVILSNLAPRFTRLLPVSPRAALLS